MTRHFLALAGIALVSATPAQAQMFAAFGDYGNESGASAVAKFVKGKNPDFIVTLGDNCYGGSPALASQVGGKYQSYVDAKKFWPALGNHDFSDGCGGGNLASGYRAYFTLPNNERYYDVVIGNVHLFAINANGGLKEPDGISATSKQALWLKAGLAASTAPWNIVFFHQPPYSSGEHGGLAALRWPFDKWGADAVLNGHDHDYERILLDGDGDGKKILFDVAGLGGAERRGFGTPVAGSVKRYSANWGALFVTATSTTIKFEFRSVTNVLVDSYSVSKSAAASTAFDFRTVP